MRKNKGLVLFLVGILICTWTYVGQTKMNKEATQKSVKTNIVKAEKKQGVSFLFVISAQKGQINKTDKGHELIMSGVYDDLLYFSDRPNRVAGKRSSDSFISTWNRAFKNDPPNAALLHDTIETKGKTERAKAIAIELENPKKLSKNKWSFQIAELPNELIKADKLKTMTLFIDSERFVEKDEQDGADCSDCSDYCACLDDDSSSCDDPTGDECQNVCNWGCD